MKNKVSDPETPSIKAQVILIIHRPLDLKTFNVCLFFEPSVWKDLGASALLTPVHGVLSVDLGCLCG